MKTNFSIFKNAKTITISLILLINIIGLKDILAIGLSNEDTTILEVVKNADDNLTIGEAKKRWLKLIQEKNEKEINNDNSVAKDSLEFSPVEARLDIDQQNILKPFTLMSHRTNYFIPATYIFNEENGESLNIEEERTDSELDDIEAQFQLSIKVPLAINLFQKPIDIFAAYTMRAFWQVYNKDISSPFRETDHEPEIWIQMHPKLDIGNFVNSINLIGINHQSNGQSGSLSRNWNRIYMTSIFECDNFVILIKPWFRLKEDAKNDDNRDITDYLGNGEIGIAYKNDINTLEIMFRNVIESNFSRGTLQLSLSFPLFGYEYIKGYLQYFSGYGESLIDYDEYKSRIGIGILLTDIL